MSNQTPTLTAEEQASLKLFIDFQNAVQAKVAQLQQKLGGMVQEEIAKLSGVSDEDLKSQVVNKLVELDPAMTEADATAALAGASREDKIGFLTQADIGAQMNALSEDEIEAILIDALKGDGTEEEAKAQLESMGPLIGMLIGQIVPQTLTPSQDFSTLSDADLDAATVKELMAQNAGTSTTDAEKQVADAPREQLEGFLAQQFAQAALGPVNPQQEVVDEMGVDIEAEQKKLQAIVEKYGQETVQNEINKLAGPAPN